MIIIKDLVRPYRQLRVSVNARAMTYYNDKIGIEQTVSTSREDDITLVKALVKRSSITIGEVYYD